MSILLAGLTVLVPPQRYEKRQLVDEQILRERIVSLANQYGRYGYRRVTAMLRNEGWLVNHKRVERIWR